LIKGVIVKRENIEKEILHLELSNYSKKQLNSILKLIPDYSGMVKGNIKVRFEYLSIHF